jgi:putative PIN family toxin of toxin-antitoxin system
MIRAVLDANVYVSAAIRVEGPPGQLIERFLRDGVFEVVMTAAMADEVRRALNYPKVRKYIRRGLDAQLWFEDIVLLARLIPGTYTLSGVTADPDDDQYVAAAVEGRAAFVVAGDADLLGIRAHEGIRIGTPRQFLRILDGIR